MTETASSTDPRPLAEAVLEACLDAAASAYEDASLSGLCQEGAWEVAVGAIRSVDLDGIVAEILGSARSKADRGASRGRGDLSVGLAKPVPSPGPGTAASAAAATGARAAGLLESAAALSEQRSPQIFGKRARTIAGRAIVLRSSLASACPEKAEIADDLLGRASGGSSEARHRATDSLLEIGARCAQVATLAAEVATQGDRTIRSDAEVALRLASVAARCALDLAREKLRSDVDEAWTLNAKRRVWRTQRLLQRAACVLPDEESD